MRRYPAVLWLLVFVGSLLILNGSHPTWGAWQLVTGIALAVIACGIAIHLAAAPQPDQPRVRGSYWLLAGTFAFYAVAALAALFALGIEEAIAVLVAGIIPMTAVGIWLAHVRQKTRVSPDGTFVDASADDHTDAVPGLGADDTRPLGDTPEAHDDLVPQDLPKDHPARHAVEEQAAAFGGATPGPTRRRPPGPPRADGAPR